MYKISEVSKMFNIPVSTLRYYDKEGLFPSLKRESGIRLFSNQDLEALRVIECLKRSGLEIKDIKLFMDWCKEGSSTYKNRYELIQNQKEKVIKEIEHLNKTLDMLKYKSWYYSKLLEGGNEENIKSMIPDNLPTDIKKAYLNAHKEEK